MELIGNFVDGINTIIGIIKMGFTTLMNIFRGLGYFFTWLLRIFDYISELIEYFPNWISQFIILGLGLSIIMIIVGRQGGTS